MKEGTIKLSDYIIIKQLTRAIQDYHDIKALPHVAVAKRLADKGKLESDNTFINYVICRTEKSDDYISDKAFSPDELIASKGKLEIDIDWYITQQLLPPISRLIEHIDGIEIDFVA